MVSTRASIITRRSYNRPLDEEGKVFETWQQTVDRVKGHQRWLWERALGRALNKTEEEELDAWAVVMAAREGTTSGRTLWLGGTDIAKTREASQFNCSGTRVLTVNDMVDAIWLLMQGCGVGGHPEPGVLNGFTKHIPSISVLRSKATEKTGEDENIETFEDGIWTIKVGDSAEAWAKAFGKLLAGKFPADALVFDLRSIRPSGTRLKGYGWISSGDTTLSKALVSIANILNKKVGQLLDRIDLLDITNWLGTVLSSRRSAEIMFHRMGDEQWEDFATAKRDFWKCNACGSHNTKKGVCQDCGAEDTNDHRQQSNNSLLFYHKPTKLELRGLFEMMLEAGGSEPGFINAQAALKRAPWFKLLNPCAEILLGDKSFCNLVETPLSKYNGRWEELMETMRLAGRANYRQTCVDLRDGVLQDTWHELNEYLRLCGVGVTGIVGWEYHQDPVAWQELRIAATEGAYSMADELKMPRPKAVTTIKPSGTLSKIMDVTEGIHKPLGKYIFNNVNFGRNDPLVPKLIAAGYHVMENPTENNIIVTFPVAWNDLDFTKKIVTRGGEDVEVEVNEESAIEQLERYKMVMENYVDHNCSITVSYDPYEVPEIVEWLYENWDTYVGVSWLLRADPTKSAEDLGFKYLPQEVVTKERYDEYVATLNEVVLDDSINSFDEVDVEDCAGGACPVR